MHQPQLTLREQNKQRGKDNGWNIWSSSKRSWHVRQTWQEKINRGEGAIKSVKPGKNLAKKRKQQDEGIKSRDKIMSDYKLKPEGRLNVRTKGNQPKINKRMSEIIDR